VKPLSDPLVSIHSNRITTQDTTILTGNHPSSDAGTLVKQYTEKAGALSFIKPALQNDAVPDATHKQTSKGPRQRPGLIMEEEQGDDVDMEGDSDNKTSGPEGVQPNDEMTITALDFLLSILEGALFQLHAFSSKYLWSLLANPTLSSQSTPTLEEILENAERLTKANTESVRALAREARAYRASCIRLNCLRGAGP